MYLRGILQRGGRKRGVEERWRERFGPTQNFGVEPHMTGTLKTWWLHLCSFMCFIIADTAVASYRLVTK